MRHKVATVTVSAALVLAAAGAYAVADAYDVVPGWITAEPVPQPPAPFLAHSAVASADVVAAPVISIASDAPAPNAAVVQGLVQDLRDDPRTGRSVNVAIVDVLTGQLIAGIDAADTQVPASTTKTLTAVAALGALGPDFTTRTVAMFDSTNARLTLVAGGDMLLAAGAGHNGALINANGWAGLGDLAEAVVAASALNGVGAVTLVVDDSAFPGPRINPEWPDYAPRLGYAAGVTGLAVDVARMEDEQYAQRYADPSVAAGNDFAEELSSRGLLVTSIFRGTASSNSVEVASVESAPLSLVAEYLLWYSDNTIAENVARVLAIETGYAATPTGAARATIAQLDAMGIDTTGLQLYDGAGFSTRNRISPLHLTDTMLAALEDPGARELIDYLPVAGVEGTVGDRYLSTDAAGMLRAKTGSLTGVTALAGTVMTGDGRLLAFAILADGMPFGQERPRAAFDELLFALVACGCE